MKAPVIITARIEQADLLPFDALRSRHFPAKRNFLRAHLTMFHKLPCEEVENIRACVRTEAAGHRPILAEVSAVRHLGAGTAFTITSPELMEIRSNLRAHLLPTLGPQDRQTWRPHITVQNGVPHTQADVLFEMLSEDFVPCQIRIIGIDIWQYLDGPWAPLESCLFSARS
ncbi:2'-5' RNA ligase family protein [Sinorhizobium sp. RAC02]|uniref:2'-5' RNA ligase family protein n=1 Tax=Sinorhizobium sp. RAC02 TaxID=1842534 RepID=UPI000856AE15|nr:2'-5' RNA ligase family protein [Sinorhizobium sp. RAC02]AOF92567.1 2'-5' RNA ligase superfamily protein [Sinorhizobium sp. RAC02]